MFNRAKVVDENFIKHVKNGSFPKSDIRLSPDDVGLTKEKCIDLFESQVMSRHLDIQARLLKESNQSFYTIGSSGHEGNVVLGDVFSFKNMAFLHYRSAALMLQRYKQLDGSTPLYDLLLSFVASADDPISGGRHKVFGSKELNVPPQTSTIASHLPKAVGAALSIPRAKSLGINSILDEQSCVICNFGDASANHSTAQGAFNTAQWISYRKIKLPIVFVCEDNGLGISVKTPPQWIEKTFKHRESMKYVKGDGLHFLDAYRAAERAQFLVQKHQMPVFLHLRTIRLLGHAGSDMETEYHRLKDIEMVEAQDPLLHSARILIEHNIASSAEIIDLYESLRNQIDRIAKEVVKKARLNSVQEVKASIVSNKKDIEKTERCFDRESLFGRNFKTLSSKKRNLSQNLNLALFDIMNENKRVLVFGEDVAKKGGVYHVTSGLVEKFNGRRVFNTLLDEQAILGTAIGMAHNGFIPIPEIQFLAYYHNAEDQIRGEAATLSFFSNKQFTNPMLLRIASFAYQKGFGGHFHNDNSIAVIRDLPGVLVFCPSNGRDAVLMLREAIAIVEREERVVIFLEPIALYMTKDLHEKDDGEWSFSYPDLDEKIEANALGSFGRGKDVAIISYANGYYLSRQAQKILKEQDQIDSKVIDLRYLSPIAIDSLLKEIEGYSHVFIVDECRKSASPSEELITLMMENMDQLPKIKRLTAEDCYIPLGTSWQYLLPSKERIVEEVREFLNRKVSPKVKSNEKGKK